MTLTLGAAALILMRLFGLGLLSDTTAVSLPTAAVQALAEDGMTPISHMPAPGFRLLDQGGRPVSLAQFRGRAVVLTFLDPVCWWDCPLQAQEMKQMLTYLPPAAERRVALVAVAANPEVHSVAAVRAFVREERLGGVPQFYFLTSPDLAVLKRIWARYYVQLAVPQNGMVLHPDLFYLIRPNGEVAYLSNPTAATANVGGTAELLAAYVARMLGATPVFPASAPRWSLPWTGRSTLAMTPGAPVMTNGEDGWRVAWKGPYEVLLHTTDGGRTWSNVSPTGISKRGGIMASFGAGDRAWVVVLPFGYEYTALAFSTADGGSTWQLAGVIPGSDLPRTKGPVLAAAGDTAYLLTRQGVWRAAGEGPWQPWAPLPRGLQGSASLRLTASGEVLITAARRTFAWSGPGGWRTAT
jgi:cytochrome oxidase Cu insertion factor (SCO1/SenC/PrrC family)